MSNTNTGGPAFPTQVASYEGMTLRDYFAAKAMQAMLDQKDAHDGREYKSAAWMAYQVAWATLKEKAE